MQNRTRNFDQPLQIYELHMGSWKLKEDGSWFQYDEIADDLIAYCKNFIIRMSSLCL